MELYQLIVWTALISSVTLISFIPHLGVEGVKVWLTLSPLIRCGSRQLEGVEHHVESTGWADPDLGPASGSGSTGNTVGGIINKQVKCVGREIQIHWAEAVPSQLVDSVPGDASSRDFTSGDWIGLFDEYPRRLSNAIRRLYLTPEDRSGENGTGISFPNLNMDEPMYLPLQKDCLGYCVAYVQRDPQSGSESIVATNCLRNQPFWMEENMSAIGHLPLYRLMLPGTHNAGSYRQSPDNPGTGRLAKYLINQDESVFDQLVYGIRYLDLRVGWEQKRGRNDTLWIVHDIFNSNVSLSSVVRQVRHFLNEAPQEVIIMDFHRFVAGFRNLKSRSELISRHKEWFDTLTAELRDVMLPFSVGYNYRLRDMVRTGKRLVVGYAHKLDHYLDSELLWPRVNHLWAETDKLPDLERFMAENVCPSGSSVSYLGPELRSAMAELTPTTIGTLMDRYGGLRVMAAEVARPVTDWFRTRYAQCANIAAVDFFLSTNIVEVAIEANRKRVQGDPSSAAAAGIRPASAYPDSSFTHCSNFLYLGRRRIGTVPAQGSGSSVLSRTGRRMYDSVRSGITTLWSKLWKSG